MSTAIAIHVQAFIIVARLKSFSAAARELGVSRSAVSQSVRQLEEHLRVVLLTRTTRSVSLTDAGRRLVETAAPALSQLLAALDHVGAEPGEVTGRLRLTVPRAAVPFVVEPVVATFRRRHPRVEVEISVNDRFVDIVAEGYDAGVRIHESIERDMLQVKLTDPFRFVVVGAPSYLARRAAPEKPQDLLKHDCITFRSQSTGALYAWELERGRKTWRVPVRGGVVVEDGAELMITLAEQGLGLTYVFEPMVRAQLRTGKLRCVLEAYSPTVPGFFMYFTKSSQQSGPLRAFVDSAKELAVRRLKDS